MANVPALILSLFLCLIASVSSTPTCESYQYLKHDVCRSCHPLCLQCSNYGTGIIEHGCLCRRALYRNDKYHELKCVDTCDDKANSDPEKGPSCRSWTSLDAVEQTEYLKHMNFDEEGKKVPLHMSKGEAGIVFLLIAIIACCCWCCV